jgi:hypothetical protein
VQPNATLTKKMNARAIGRLYLDPARLQPEIDTLLTFDFNSGYSEYTRGNPGWSNCVLMNRTGDFQDRVFGGYEGLPQRTKWAAQLPYLNEVIDTTFKKDHLKWVRIFMCENGMLIPHRDYLEFENEAFTRVHIPLQTGPNSLHSEEEKVYHMRMGEVWFVDGTVIHSAYSYDDQRRIFLTFDFESGVPFKDLFVDPAIYANDVEPKHVARQPFEPAYETQLRGLSRLIHADNFDDIISILAKVHFTRDVTCAVVYDWLIDIARDSGQPALVERAIATKRYFIGE